MSTPSAGEPSGPEPPGLPGSVLASLPDSQRRDPGVPIGASPDDRIPVDPQDGAAPPSRHSGCFTPGAPARVGAQPQNHAAQATHELPWPAPTRAQ